MVDRRSFDRPQDRAGDVGRPRDLQKMSSRRFVHAFDTLALFSNSPCFRISIDRSKNTPSDRRNIRYRRCSNGQKVLEQSRSSGDESDEASSMIEGHPTLSISRIIPISDKGGSASTFLYLEFLGHRVSRNIRERRKSCSFHQDETHRSLYKKLRPSFVPCHRRRLVIDASSLNHPGFPWGDGLPRPVDFALGDRFRSFRSPTAFEKTEARVSV